MRVLVIDDLRVARETTGEVYARFPAGGIQQLRDHDWDLVFLDHDLGFDYVTGDDLTIWPCIEYIEQNVEKFRDTMFTVISSSPRAANIVYALEVAGLQVDRWTMRDVSIVFKTLDPDYEV